MIEDLKKILFSIAKELEINGAKVVCGDTKVAPRGVVNKLFINISGIGEVVHKGISAKATKEGSAIIASGSVGDHGATIFASREGIDIREDLKSDCATLYPIVATLLSEGIALYAVRDATRGGMAAVLNEWCINSKISFEIDESSIPIKESVRGLCEILGFEARNLTNEEMFFMAVAQDKVDKALEVLYRI